MFFTHLIFLLLILQTTITNKFFIWISPLCVEHRTITISHPCEIRSCQNFHVATLLWPSVGVKPNTWRKRGFEVLWDSRMFRVRQQGPKHLSLRCSWCHQKGLEAQISKMSFGRLQPKLWAKEGPGVKLAVWLPTTKRRESTSSRPPN